MKRALLSLLLAGTVALIGCGRSGDAPEPTPGTPAAPETPAAPQPPETPAPPPGGAASSLTEKAGQVVEATKEAAAAWTDSFAASFQPSSDAVLKDIGNDIVTRVQTAAAAFGSDATLQDQLKGAVDALAGSKDGEAVGFLGKLNEAKLTTDQEKTLGDLKNAVTAFVVQRNFSSLTDAQTELGKVVAALRGGDTATALTQLKQMTSKVSLTPEQSSLLNQLVEQYAPTLKDAGKTLEEGLKSLNPLGQP